jgi:hypothetical protein
MYDLNTQTTKGKILEDTDTGNYFLNRSPNAQEIRAKSNKWDCIKLRSFFTTKEKSYESRNNLQKGRKSSPANQQIKG